MKIGLLSDSHGRASTTQRAVQLLLEQEVEVILHLGDIGSVEVIDALIERVERNGTLHPPVHVVFGNTDWDSASLAKYAQSLGIAVDDPVGRMTAGEKTVVFQHGHVDAAMRQALAEGADFLFHGHTHRTRDETVGDTRIINPGALFRAAEYTVAVVDTDSGDCRFHKVPEY